MSETYKHPVAVHHGVGASAKSLLTSTLGGMLSTVDTSTSLSFPPLALVSIGHREVGTSLKKAGTSGAPWDSSLGDVFSLALRTTPLRPDPDPLSPSPSPHIRPGQGLTLSNAD